MMSPRTKLAWIVRTCGLASLLAAGLMLSGCVQMSDHVSAAFVDPAKYDLYSCAQLRGVRRDTARRVNDLKALMAKAETGTGGPLIAEMAYGNDYLSARAQANLADEVWQKHHCDSEPIPSDKPAVPPPAAPPPVQQRR